MITKRPKEVDLTKLDRATAKYIADLEEMLSKLNSDPIVKLYVALKVQLRHISEAIEKNTILDITDNDDKSFDRTLKLSTESKKIVENIKYLEGIINPEDVKEPEAEVGSVESFVRGRKK